MIAEAEIGLGEPVTIQELEDEIALYEGRHEMLTSEFLRRFNNPLDTLDGIEDADLWVQASEFLEHLRVEERSPVPPWLCRTADEANEGPNRVLFLF